MKQTIYSTVALLLIINNPINASGMLGYLILFLILRKNGSKAQYVNAGRSHSHPKD